MTWFLSCPELKEQKSGVQKVCINRERGEGGGGGVMGDIEEAYVEGGGG